MRKAKILANKQLEIKQDTNDPDAWYKIQSARSGYLMSDMFTDIYEMLKSLPKAKKKASDFRSFLAKYSQIIYQCSNQGYFPLYNKVKEMHSTLSQEKISITRKLPPWYDKFAETKYLNLILPTMDKFIAGTTHLSTHTRCKLPMSWFSITETSHKNMRLDDKSTPLTALSGISAKKQISMQDSTKKKTKSKNKETSPNGMLKVRLYPTPHQKEKLDKMVLANRYAWNLMAELTGGYRLFDMPDAEIEAWYRPFMTKKLMNDDLYVKECPEECFDSAYRDIIKAKHAIFAASEAKKLRGGKGFKCPKQLNFKTKKQGSVSIEIRARNITYDAKNRTIALYPEYFQDKSKIIPTITRKFGKEAGYNAKTIAKLNKVIIANNNKIKDHHKIRMKTDLAKLGITKFDYSCRLTQYYGDYYLLVPYIRDVEPANSNRVCAIDPGVRTFLTGYDPSGATFEIASNNDHLYKKKMHIERLQKVLNTVVDRTQKDKINTQIRNIYRKIKNCVHDLNHCASKMLSQTYDEILLPKFSTSEMIKKSDKKRKRRINAVTAYNMQTLSHYKFQQLLKHKMEIRNGKLHICSEEFTSKTCGACGRLNHNLKAKKVFVCPFEDCKITMDRDINGARNIFIKNINLVGCKSYHRPEPAGKPILL